MARNFLPTSKVNGDLSREDLPLLLPKQSKATTSCLTGEVVKQSQAELKVYEDSKQILRKASDQRENQGQMIKIVRASLDSSDYVVNTLKKRHE